MKSVKDMNFRPATYAVIVTAIIGLIGFDILPLISEAEGDSISEVVRDVSWSSQMLPAFLGFVGGHLLWHRKGGRYFEWSRKLIPVLLAGTVALDFFVSDMNPLIVAGVYFVLGHFLWPQDSNKREL